MISTLIETFVYAICIWFFVGGLAYFIKRREQGLYKIDIVAERKPLFRASLFGPIFIYYIFYKAESKNTIRFWAGILGATIAMRGFFILALNDNSFSGFATIVSMVILTSTIPKSRKEA